MLKWKKKSLGVNASENYLFLLKINVLSHVVVLLMDSDPSFDTKSKLLNLAYFVDQLPSVGWTPAITMSFFVAEKVVSDVFRGRWCHEPPFLTSLPRPSYKSSNLSIQLHLLCAGVDLLLPAELTTPSDVALESSSLCFSTWKPKAISPIVSAPGSPILLGDGGKTSPPPHSNSLFWQSLLYCLSRSLLLPY